MPSPPDPLTLARAGHVQSIVQVVRAELIRRGWRAQVRFTQETLHIDLMGYVGSLQQPEPSPQATVAQLFLLLKQLRIPRLEQVEIRAFRGAKLLWQRSLRLRARHAFDTFDNLFDNLTVNIWALPLAGVVAFLVNHIGLLQLLHLPLHIWIHELGHATVAWWSGHRALPLPFGWTGISPQEDPFVYWGILFLLGLLFWSGRKEQKVWPQVLAIALALLQFYMSWIMPNSTKEMLIAFGGVGGEFYLSTFLIACFYFRFPDRWRWDFWRFVVLAIAASSLWKSFWQWRSIQAGTAEIPWGTLFGGQGDAGGDMNRLRDEFGWSSDQIVQTYNTLGSACVLFLLGLYVFFLLRMNDDMRLYLQARFTLWIETLVGTSKRR